MNIIDKSDSESDNEFIDLEDIIKEQDPDKFNIYQIQLTNNEMIIKLVARESYVPDVIIKENFGKNGSLSLYSCLYSEDDFKINIDENSNYYFPLIKLIEKSNDQTKSDQTDTSNQSNTSNQIEPIFTIYSFTVKFTNLSFDTKISDYELYVVFNKSNEDFVYTNLIEKNVNSNNIVEKILEYYNHITDSINYANNLEQKNK